MAVILGVGQTNVRVNELTEQMRRWRVSSFFSLSVEINMADLSGYWKVLKRLLNIV